MRIGVVSEGPGEHAIVEAVAQRIDPDVIVDPIWPDTTASGRPFGWKGVSSWCAEHGPKLEVFMRGVIGREYDILVIHADCSMAHNLGITNPCPPAATTANQLGAVLLGWLSRPVTCWIVTMTPSLTSDAWITSTLAPPCVPRGGVHLECDPQIEGELANRRLLPRKQGVVKKPREKYRALVATMVAQWELVTQACTQAAAFQKALTEALECVAQGHGPK